MKKTICILALLWVIPAEAQRLSPQGGTITAVQPTAGGGLAGGGTGGSVSLGLITSCASSEVLKWNGLAWACAPATIGTGTINTLAKFVSSITIGDSLVTDNGTTFAINVNKFTVVEASGNTMVAGTLTVSPMTIGSVLFAGTAGVVSQDNAAFFWDDTAKGLTITSPNGTAIGAKSNSTSAGTMYITNTNASGPSDFYATDNAGTAKISFGYGNGSYSDAARAGKGYLWRNASVNFVFARSNTTDATLFSNGNWNIGTTTTDPGVKLRVEGDTVLGTAGATTNRVTSNGGIDAIESLGTTFAGLDSLTLSPMAAWDNTAQATGVGGGILFVGKYTNAGDYAGGAGIKMMKTNSTTADFGFGLALGTRPNGGSLTSRMFLTSAGEAVFGDSLVAPTKSGFSTTFEVSRNSASSRFMLSSFGTSIQSTMYMYRGRGTAASTTAIQNTDGIGSLAFTGATGAGSSDFFEGARISATATENWSLSSNFGTKLEFTTTTNAAGSGGRAIRLTIDHDGTATFANAVTQNAGNVLLNQTSGATAIGGASTSLGRLSVFASSGDLAAIIARNVLTGQTLSGAAALQGVQTGTYDTTAAGRSSIAVSGSSTSTRSAGANNLTNTGGLFTASGAQVNIGLQTNSGHVLLNTVDGSASVGLASGTPDAKLQVKNGTSGAAAILSSTVLNVENNGDMAISISGPTNNYKAIFFRNPTSGADGGILYDDNANGFARGFQFRTGGNVTRMTIDLNGVIIDTRTVGTTLSGSNINHVLRDDTSMAQGVGGAIRFDGNSVGSTPTTAAVIKAFKTNGTSSNNSFNLYFGTRLDGDSDVTRRLSINNDGKVIISNADSSGSIQGGTQLLVSKATGDTAITVQTRGEDRDVFMGVDDTNDYARIGTSVSQILAFRTNNANHMHMDASGQLNIGDVGISTIDDNVDVVRVANTGTGQTSSKQLVYATHTGSFDTTAGNLTNVGVRSDVTSTRSAGANTLQNIAAYFSASGGQANYALATIAGDVVLNSASGLTAINGLLYFGAHQKVSGTALVNGDLSSCGGGTPTASGTDVAGRITEGTTATGCVLTFKATYTSAPYCTCSSETAGVAVTCVATATTLTFSNASASGNVFTFHCIGQSDAT